MAVVTMAGPVAIKIPSPSQIKAAGAVKVGVAKVSPIRLAPAAKEAIVARLAPNAPAKSAKFTLPSSGPLAIPSGQDVIVPPAPAPVEQAAVDAVSSSAGSSFGPSVLWGSSPQAKPSDDVTAATPDAMPVASPISVSVDAPPWAWIAGGIFLVGAVGFALYKHQKGRR